ncbi:hypothetical protein MVEN_02316600 [Mycena venus]|uniref:Uncharacterized protein n=1 Tax=Mycena venus TaxID=2733690 RepID=A0A8H7CG05_9AGAR|nr:hypothetical protein MVEN_02316600 [Mycena venus]
MLRLNGDEARRQHKRKKKERERETKLARLRAKVQDNPLGEGVDAVSVVNGFSTSMPQPSAATKAFLQARPSIHIATMQRSVSVTPPPFTSPLLLPSIPASTPGPSNSPSTWRISSKRPPSDDYVDLVRSVHERPSSSRKPRASAKKGWKGWVEGSPPPSGKLINLETVPVFPERRTRSGKNFDAIGVGKDGWV